MNDLRRVGWTLIVVGIVDIGLMIYCIAHGINYSSSFNIFAIVAGILLLRGSLKTARIVAWFSAFMLSGIVGMLVVAPFWMPSDYLRALFRVRPLMSVELAVVVLGFFPFLIWIYRTLADPKIESAVEKPIQPTSKWWSPKAGFVAGVSLAVVLGGLLGFMGRSETAQKAIANAEGQVGPNYKFFVSSVRTNSTGQGTNVNAMVEAYNDNEIRDVRVNFSE